MADAIIAITFGFTPGAVMGFWLARMIYVPQIHTAELRGLTNRRVMELSRTDAENAAGMVS